MTTRERIIAELKRQAEESTVPSLWVDTANSDGTMMVDGTVDLNALAKALERPPCAECGWAKSIREDLKGMPHEVEIRLDIIPDAPKPGDTMRTYSRGAMHYRVDGQEISLQEFSELFGEVKLV